MKLSTSIEEDRTYRKMRVILFFTHKYLKPKHRILCKCVRNDVSDKLICSAIPNATIDNVTFYFSVFTSKIVGFITSHLGQIQMESGPKSYGWRISAYNPSTNISVVIEFYLYYDSSLKYYGNKLDTTNEFSFDVSDVSYAMNNLYTFEQCQTFRRFKLSDYYIETKLNSAILDSLVLK